MPFAGPGSLPAIMGSPTKFGGGIESRSPESSMPAEPVHAPFGVSRPRTVPDNMAALQFGNGGGKSRFIKCLLMSLCYIFNTFNRGH